jgi:hypothetical protein
MGIYGARGIELCLELKDGNMIVVLTQHETDDRLLKCQYYQAHSASWFADLFDKQPSYTKINSEDTVDLQLTDQEITELRSTIERYHNDEIAAVGWYDVISFTNTYG